MTDILQDYAEAVCHICGKRMGLPATPSTAINWRPAVCYECGIKVAQTLGDAR